MPSYGGTLAAARCLGQRGIPVTMAGDALLCPARWSRHVQGWLRAPNVLEAEPFFEWLMEFGRRQPGHVLYPTCDDLAWLFADRAAELARYFRLYQPDASVILQLLDKKALYETCTELGIPTLPTTFPIDVNEALEQAKAVGFPMLLKPRTQVFLTTRCKGIYIDTFEELAHEYPQFFLANPFHPPLRARVPGIERPMLQAFRPNAASNIYSISGFIGRGSQGVAARAAIKVLQRPRRLGVGLCFEEAPVDPVALESLVGLCKKVGYFGVFEAEFVPRDDKLHLIDFNPRYYGQMGFEIARELPLGYMVWLGALDQGKALTEELERARNWKEGRGYVYCNRFFFNLMLKLQRASGWMRHDEQLRWRDWLDQPTRRGLAFDPVDAPDDRWPAIAAAVRDMYFAFRHPRSFYRQMIVGP